MPKPTVEVDVAELATVPGSFGNATSRNYPSGGIQSWGTGQPENLFDGRMDTSWVDLAGNSWVCLSLNRGAEVILRGYTLTSSLSGPEGSDPQDWLLESSADGKKWVMVDERRGVKFPGRGVTQTFQPRWQLSGRAWRLIIKKTRAAEKCISIELGGLGFLVDRHEMTALAACAPLKGLSKKDVSRAAQDANSRLGAPKVMAMSAKDVEKAAGGTDKKRGGEGGSKGGCSSCRCIMCAGGAVGTSYVVGETCGCNPLTSLFRCVFCQWC